MMSESIAELAAALVEAQGSFKPVTRDSMNPHFRSKFASLASVVDATREVLKDNGLAVSQYPSEGDVLVTFLIHKSGQFISSAMPLHLAKNDPQGMGSALTYARRYSYMAVLGLVADDEDDDGNAASRPAERSHSTPQSVPDDSARPFVDDDPLDATDPGPLVVRKGKLKAMQRVELNEWCAAQGMPDHPVKQSPDQRALFAARLTELEGT